MQDLFYFVNHTSYNLFLSVAWVTVLIAWLSVEIKTKKFGPKRLNSDDLIALVNQHNAIVYDIRPAAEYAKGHISQALNFQFSDLNDIKVLTSVLLKKLDLHKDAPVVLVCKDGVKSSQEASKLQKADPKIKKVCFLNGGMLTWSSDNLPTVSS